MPFLNGSSSSFCRRWGALRLRIGRNLLLLLLCISLNGNAFAQLLQTQEQEQAAESDSPFDDIMKQANELIIELKFAAAEGLLRAQMMRTMSPEERHILNYLLSLALVGQEKYKDAEKILRKLLLEQPAATNVRLSLGRVLFRLGNDTAAERQLDLVLADQTAPDFVRQQAQLHLAQIRERNGWVVNRSFTITRTDNVDSAPPAGNVIYVHIFGSLLPFSPSQEVKSAYVGNWSASAAYRQQMSGRAQVEGRIAAYGTMTEDDFDSSLGLQLSVGPRFLFNRGLLGISAVAGEHFSPEPVSRSIGMSAFWQYALPRGWRPYGSAQYLIQNHLHDNELDSASKNVQVGVRFGLDSVTNGNIAFGYTRNAARVPKNASTTWRFSTDFQRDFGYGLTFGGDLSYTRSEFDAGISALIPLAERFSQTDVSIFVLKRDFQMDFLEIGGFVPKLIVSRATKRSNNALKDFQKNSIALEFTSNF